MTYPNFSQSSKVLLAAAMVSTVLGSIHAFSILLVPLETLFVATRSAVSLTYSFALVSLSIAVLLGHLFYGRVSPATFLMATCSLAAVGAVVAGMASSLWVVWFGYGVLFGVANGLGYGFGLQLAAQTYPGREGFSMGIVTAAYALGAVISPTLFNFILESLDFSAVMIALAVALLVVGLLSRVILTQVGATFRTDQQGDVSTSASHRSQLLLWVGYFGGVLAGLMVIGHSAGVAGAPKLGDKAKWAPLIKEGQVQLTAHGYVGVRGMPAKGGKHDLSVVDFAASLVYMVNQSGGNWQNPNDLTLKKIEAEIIRRQAQLRK